MSRKDTKNEIADDEVMEEQTPETDTVVEETPESEEAVDENVVLQAENAELKEKILRMAAENQNTRKRLVKQQQDAFKYRHQDILRDLAEVMDNFERAIESSIDSRDFDTFHEKQFSGMLTERYGLERIGSEGEAYDPAAHEAMMLEESSDVEVETIKQVFQAGYRLHERILRPAKVVVYKPALAAVTEDAENDGDD